MTMKPDSNIEHVIKTAVARVVSAIRFLSYVRSLTKVVSPKLTVRVSRARPLTKRARGETLFVTIGAPNYLDLKFVKACTAAGEKFPVKRLRFQMFPKRK